MSNFQDIEKLQAVREELNAFIGKEELKRAHRTIFWLDIVAIIAAFTVLIANFWCLARNELPWYALAVAALVQGWLVTVMGLMCHDMFVHRQVLGGRVGSLLAALLFIPSTTPYSKYRLGHLRHHSYIGTPEDTEIYKQDVNTFARRAFFMTAIGFKMGTSGKWSKELKSGYGMMVGANAAEVARAKYENIGVLMYIVTVAVWSYFTSWNVLVFGLLIPLLLVAPFLNTLRIIIEHGDLDPSNDFWIATAYETGFVSKFLFFADSGDCHLLHHIYPRVPFYGMSRLTKLTRPFLESKGVKYRSSYLTLLKGWFLYNYPHRSPWPVGHR